MSAHEAIIAEIDRTFTDSLGHWTGDAIWQETIPGFTSGIAALILGPHQTEKTMQITYPHIKVTHGIKHNIAFSAHFPGEDTTITIKWQLTDGTYTMSEEFPLFSLLRTHNLSRPFIIPHNFNPKIAILSISALAADHDSIDSLYTDLYALTYKTRIDHIPLMGVG